jgi:formate hydrogenlyase subunit 3/multisubunit Na+/H+ antiporter MnhD subunit
MPYAAPALDEVSTTGGFLLVLSLVVPVVGVLLAFAAGGRHVERVAFATMPLGLAIAVAIAVTLRQTGSPLAYLLGGWAPPLGVALRADGLSTVMMMITAVVICAVGLFARADFRTPAGSPEARAPFAFWILLVAIWGALNTVFLAGDLFTLYVALELVTFAAVPLVSLDGRAETLQAALRYLLFALLGSVLYLVGTALLYGVYGTLDIVLLSRRTHAEPVTLVAAALMTVGLLAKTALVPLHLWLPPAHAGAPAAGSAVLSALVVKGSFFIAVRLWFDVMPAVPGFAAAQLLAGLGAAAIVLGSVVALRQQRLKLLIAYSTLAQIGYLFLMFPLAFNAASGKLERGGALAGGLLQAISHATAKAAMFMAAGSIYAALGRDRITELGGVGRVLPVSVLAFALGGLALIGVPTSGADLAKDLLLGATAETGQWWWALVIQAGGFFTGGYLVLVLAHALVPADAPITLRGPVSRVGEAAALVLAVCSLLLGLVQWEPYLPVPRGTLSNPFDLDGFAKALWPILGGALLAVLLGRWGGRLARMSFGQTMVAIVGPVRRLVLALGGMVVRIDGVLRQWPAAAVSLLVLGLLFGAAMFLAAR